MNKKAILSLLFSSLDTFVSIQTLNAKFNGFFFENPILLLPIISVDMIVDFVFLYKIMSVIKR